MPDLFPRSPDLDQQIECVERLLVMREPVKIPIGPHAIQTIVDLEDLHLLAMHNWHSSSHNYLRRSVRGTSRAILFHREVIEAPPNCVVDHINGNVLDNRKANLRIATAQQNSMNSKSIGGTSKYKGVSFQYDHKRWVCAIKSGDHIKHSVHKTEIEAAKTYDAQAKILHGEFARLNFPNFTDRADHEIAAMQAVLKTLQSLNPKEA